jgi:hypothetical protein
MRITDTVSSDSMGTGWIDNRRTAAAFAEHLTSVYEATYPDADVNVEVDGSPAGACAEGNGEIEENLRVTHQDAWESWCCSPAAQSYVSA